MDSALRSLSDLGGMKLTYGKLSAEFMKVEDDFPRIGKNYGQVDSSDVPDG